MAKIPLRAYLKEIEGYIERGEIDQAIAHAKNIIRSYPKQIDAYRLLGKAFLESQRFTEASDILQRVLSVLPDDFVSQIGMSIIREDEGNLDAAIWHMERAYEVQPFNPAVQDELRRLYGRRDGLEPPKIRLTRGALVRMYIRGELYPQAIAEIRAALADDPQRFDLQVLLARLYNLSNQKFEATEVCSTLISKLPYCLEPNQILAEILPGTSRAEDAKKFQQRIYALDPYAAFTSPTAPTSDLVPDQAVMVEQYVWTPSGDETQAPEWTRTIGVEWEESPEETLPDWINTLKVEEPSTQLSAEPSVEFEQPQEEEPSISLGDEKASQADLVPDFLKDAGWTASDRPADEVAASEEEMDESISPAEIPGWLQEMAPDQSAETTPEDMERTDWLEGILQEPASSSEEEVDGTTLPDKGEGIPVMPDWLSNQLEEAGEQPAPEEQAEADELAETEGYPAEKSEGQESSLEEFPSWSAFEEKVDSSQASAAEWLTESGEEEAQVEEPGEQIPDWLKSLESGTEDSTEEEKTPATPTLPGLPVEEDTAVDLSGFELPETPEGEETSDLFSSAEETGDTSAWLDALHEAEDSTLAEQPTSLEAQAEDIPDWLQAFEGEETPESELDQEGQEPTSEGKPSIAAGGEPAEPGEQPQAIEFGEIVFPTDQEETAEGKTTSLLEGQIEEETLRSEQEPAGTEEAAPSFALDDMDAAMAWLESLAARQGADEATLITPPDQRVDKPPEWVQQEAEAVENPPAAEIPSIVEEQPVSEELSGDEEQPLAVEMPESIDMDETLPAEGILSPEENLPATEYLMAEEETEMGEPATAKATVGEEAAPDFNDMDAAMAWLESLAARQGADEATLVTSPEERLETPPDWVAQEIDRAQQAETTPPEVEVPPTQETEETIFTPGPGEVEPQRVDEILEPSLQQVEDVVSEVEPAEEKLSLPDILQSPEEQASEGEKSAEETSPWTDQAVPDWLQGVGGEEEAIQASEPSAESEASSAETESLPQWLQEEGAEPVVPIEGESVSDWLSTIGEEETEAFSTVEKEPGVPTEEFRAAWVSEPSLEKRDAALEPEKAQATSLPEIKDALIRGDIEIALDSTNLMVSKGENLEEIISALRDSLYRYPVDITIWQALGDAYAANNQLQEALDAYAKAEELLR